MGFERERELSVQCLQPVPGESGRAGGGALVATWVGDKAVSVVSWVPPDSPDPLGGLIGVLQQISPVLKSLHTCLSPLQPLPDTPPIFRGIGEGRADTETNNPAATLLIRVSFTPTHTWGQAAPKQEPEPAARC